MTQKLKKIESLQDLRGVAILMVVLFHSAGASFGNNHIFVHGGNGVLLFFMISGFIIASVHQNDRGTYKFLIFMKKRFIRIYLPYLPIFIIFLFLFYISGKGSAYHTDLTNIARNSLLVQNPSESIHPYSWSLVFEMFYYLTFAMLVIQMSFSIWLYIFIMITPLIFFQEYCLSGYFSILFSHYNYYFLTGIILFLLIKKLKANFSLFFFILVSFLFFLTPFFTNNEFYILITTALQFFIYLKRDKTHNFLNTIGNASFSIYLSHALVVSIGKHVIPDIKILKFILLVFTSIFLGCIYYKYIEKKLLQKIYIIFYT